MKNKKVIILISIIIVVICIVGGVSIYKYNSKVDYNKYFNRTINNKVNKKICLDKLCIDNMQIIDEKNLEIINADILNTGDDKISKGTVVLEFTLKDGKKVDLSYSILDLDSKSKVPFEFQSKKNFYKDAISVKIKSFS